jgi:two-component system LytT family sensor kinase
MLERRWIRWLLIFGCWTLLGLFSATRMALNYAYGGYPVRWQPVLTFALTDWYVWALLSPMIVWLARRFAIEPRAGNEGFLHSWWRRGLLVHLPAAILFPLLKLIIEYRARQLLYPDPRRTFQILQFHSALITYLAILGVIYAFAYYRKYREHELKSSRLETQLAQAQLAALKMQLHPHFLFNTLHAISALMHKDVEAADRMITRLSDLLRLALENAGVQEVPLRQELDFLERYLEIEQIRFRDRLKVQMEIEPETLDAQVPNLILQPLVENAIRHGIAPRAAPGLIEIRAARRNRQLELEVRDDGPGLPASAPHALKEGVGLANTRARLQQLYGAEYRFALDNAAAGGLVASLALPFRAADENGTVTEPPMNPDEHGCSQGDEIHHKGNTAS